ncbi:hypothetical protein EYF80_053881 [Liparis tanakae]|uniref:Uncharacterized protein n=1 Tax=Liparis tanakae TaxID=230148 RepID=A0A4Z2F5C5_9TELE|nr:hypothetical protein EYF80_053881 [Liparis tanakae]
MLRSHRTRTFSTRLTQDSDARRKKGVHTGRVGRVETRRRTFPSDCFFQLSLMSSSSPWSFSFCLS